MTNARLDRTDVQGASPEQIAVRFPVRAGGTLVTADPIVATLLEGSGFLAVYAAGVVLGNGVLPYRHGLTQTHDAVAWKALRGGAGSDLIVTSGGVSVGQHDYVRGVLEDSGSLDFWRIAVQPGKPLAVGEIAGVTVVGLPGNPVSALVTFELFVRPMIRAMLDLGGDGRLRVQARPLEPIGKDARRRAFLRVTVWHEAGETLARLPGL